MKQFQVSIRDNYVVCVVNNTNVLFEKLTFKENKPNWRNYWKIITFYLMFHRRSYVHGGPP
jgi:hypothetical protein